MGLRTQRPGHTHTLPRDCRLRGPLQTRGPSDAIVGTGLPASWSQKTSQWERLLLILGTKEPGSDDLWDQLTGGRGAGARVPELMMS